MYIHFTSTEHGNAEDLVNTTDIKTSLIYYKKYCLTVKFIYKPGVLEVKFHDAKLNQISTIFIQENEYENVIFKMVAIFPQPWNVNCVQK